MKREEFERLYEEHAVPLYGFLAYRTGNPTLAEDLLADTFERVWVARARFDLRRGSKKNWIYSIALNRLRDLARRNGVETRAMEEVGAVVELQSRNGHSDQERAELRHVLLAGLATLELAEREALALRYGADLSLKEIAQVLQVPRSTVEGRLARGLKKLWKDLTGEPEPVGAEPNRSAGLL